MNCHSTVASAFLFAMALGACAHDGTLVTLQPEPANVVRATDQQLLADAIDRAFEQLDLAGLKAKIQASTAVTGYVEVAAPTPLPKATLDYAEQRAALAAGQIGLSVLEVSRTIGRLAPETGWHVLQEVYPETDARVIMLISYAGVDTVETKEKLTTHAPTAPDRVLKGRFKATFAVTPRKARFDAVSLPIVGESEIKIQEGAFIDQR